MTNREYVIDKFKDKYLYIENIMEFLCPKEFDESLNQIDNCNGNCDKCWEIKAIL